MPLPTKREDLVALGYEFVGEGKCKFCGEYVEWWATPRQKRMPMTVLEIKKSPLAPVERYDRVPHQGICKGDR